MHILESMASVGRLKISKPIISPKYYPVAYEKYITIHSSAKFNSRRYDWWNEVIEFIKPVLAKHDIKIVQIGGKDDEPLKDVDANLCGQVSFRQTFFVVQNALLHVGVDSLPIHIASAVGTKIVGLYCNMHSSQSKPYWTKDEDCILIQSDRKGLKPSYAPEENPKTINNIKPEKIVKAIYKLLKLEECATIESLHFGDRYRQVYLETIPDHIVHPEFQKNIPLTIRYDYVKENQTTENFVYQQLSVRKSFIVTDKSLNINVLKQLRGNILQVIYKITDKHDVNFVKQLTTNGIPYVMISNLPQEKIDTIKLDYTDFSLILPQKTFSKESLSLNDKIDYSKSHVKVNKFLLSNNQIYFTKAHWLLGLAIKDLSINDMLITEAIDNADFWEEADAYYIYNK